MLYKHGNIGNDNSSYYLDVVTIFFWKADGYDDVSNSGVATVKQA